MSQAGTVYAEALYALAKEEGLDRQILRDMQTINTILSAEKDFLRLLGSAAVPKEERCGVVDDVFRDRVHPYLLNFLKILTEKGYMHLFGECCDAYRALYNKDNGILIVTAVTAVSLTGDQAARLKDKLTRITGKTVELETRIDPACIGGIRLDYDGKRLDDTMAHRLDSLRSILKNTVL